MASTEKNFVDAIREAEGVVADTMLMADRLANRLCGYLPEADSVEAVPPTDGVFDEAKGSAQAIRRTATHIQSCLSRIEAALPSENKITSTKPYASDPR